MTENNKNILILLGLVVSCISVMLLAVFLAHKEFEEEKELYDFEEEMWKAKQAPYKQEPISKGYLPFDINIPSHVDYDEITKTRMANMIAQNLMSVGFPKEFRYNYKKQPINPILQKLEKQMDYDKNDERFKLNG